MFLEAIQARLEGNEFGNGTNAVGRSTWSDSGVFSLAFIIFFGDVESIRPISETNFCCRAPHQESSN